MATPLLQTKLYIPPPRPNLVSRPRLIERLNAGLHRKLTLISAPAGFGKTTLVTEWLNSAERPFTWLSLDENDNDPTRFLTYLLAALRRLALSQVEGIDPSIGQAAQAMLQAPQPPPPEPLLTALINDIAAIPRPFVLVLDDYHLIDAQAINAGIGFLLDHQPPNMHLVVASRVDLPLPLARLRSRGQLTELRVADLRFTTDEAAAFLNQVIGLNLSDADVAALEARTEGWIAGLQMAALSMQGREDVTGFIAAFTGSHRYVLDYLTEEVLDQQTESVQSFLLETSILDRLSGPLCDAVTDQEDGQATLERLERANLFVVPLDDERRWYRYHRLFADFLRTELGPAQSAALHLKAAHWFETHDLLPEAVNHVLAYAAATGDTDEAVRVITLAGDRALSDGALVTLLGWLDALPDEVVRASGWLASFKAWSLFMTGQPEAGLSYVQATEASLGPDASPVDRGRVLSLRCAIADAEEILRMAPQALDLIGDADPLSRTGTLFMLGDAQDAVGDVAGAIETFREAHHLGQQHGHQIMAAVALAHLAISINYQGRRREAFALCQRGASQYADTRGNPLPVAGLIYVVLGELAYAANDLEQAQQYLQEGVELGQQSATTLVILYGLEALAQVQHAMGRAQEALATIQKAQELASQAGELEWRNTGAAIEAALHLRQGDIQTAERWAEKANLPLTEPLDQTRKYEYTNYVRVLLALDRAREAQALLARLERAAREDGRRCHLLTIHIQQALAEQILGNQAKALKYLEQALRLAAPEGYVRAFLDEELALVQLLPHARHVAPEFVNRLLSGFEARESLPRSHTPALIEPLSERELQVLRLLATDLSAPEIADALIVAVSTVRSHVKHIYQKLNAHSRYEAVERARTLGLL